MVLLKGDMLRAIDTEIEDIETRDAEVKADYKQNIEELKRLREVVVQEYSLPYNDYEWLADLVMNWRENLIREEEGL